MELLLAGLDMGSLAGWLPVLMLAVLFLAVLKRKLTPAAGFTAFILGWIVLEGAGLVGATMLIGFFAMGVLASAYKKKVKRNIKAGIPHSEERNVAQVLANGGITGILAVLAFMDAAHLALFVLLIAGSLASAAADTIASELGTVLGKRYVNVLSFRQEERGLDGVISLEGTVAGLLAAAMIALIYSAFMGFSRDGLYIILAGALGNWMDSVLGASLQRRALLNNDTVNAANTLTGAIAALALKLIFG